MLKRGINKLPYRTRIHTNDHALIPKGIIPDLSTEHNKHVNEGYRAELVNWV